MELELIIYGIITFFVCVITGLIIYARWYYGTLERIKGLPVVIKPWFIGGSDILMHKHVLHFQDQENVKKYGSIYGYYEGREPQIYISDPELVRLIFVKDFDHFHTKRMLDFGHRLVNEMMDVLPYEKWKPVRSFLSPTLTTGKIRAMSIQMVDAIQSFVQELDKYTSQDGRVNARQIYAALTTDVIAKCAFGTKIDALKDPNSDFVKHVDKLAGNKGDINFLLTLAATFPFLSKLEPFVAPDTLLFFEAMTRQILESRRKNSVKVNDFVDLLNEMLENCSSAEYKSLGITENTVFAQALLFILAGFETTASTLTSMSYCLAKHSDIQTKLLNEVDAYLKRHDGAIEHETISELTYMSAVMYETLRMFPVLIRLERVCQKDWKYEPLGLEIPKGMTIQVPVYAVHMNSKYFPNPTEFNPDRFLQENKSNINPYAFLSFGQGNHNCIGMRFAKEEILLTMTHVLRNHTFHLCDDSKVKARPGYPFITALEPIFLRVEKRKLK